MPNPLERENVEGNPPVHAEVVPLPCRDAGLRAKMPRERNMVGPVMTTPPVSNPPSLELLRRARAGDDSALNRLFQRYLPSLHRWAHGRIPRWARNSVDTADVVQETVLQTIRNLGSFEPQREGALLGYLRRSLLNRIRDRFRYAARHPAPAELTDTSADAGASPLDLAIDEEDRRRYEEALDQIAAWRS